MLNNEGDKEASSLNKEARAKTTLTKNVAKSADINQERCVKPLMLHLPYAN